MSASAIEIYLNINPATLPTAQQKGLNRKTGRIYTKTKIRNARSLLLGAIQAATGGIHEASPKGAWEVHVAYFYHPKTFPRRLWGKLKTTRPDCDNLTKLIHDVIAELGIGFADDAQAAITCQTKRYVASPDEPPHIVITLKRAE